MKKLLPFLICCFIHQLIKAQITTPVVKANFGVDADLRANYFNGLVSGAGDDWYNNGTAGSGQFVIDTTGAAALVAAYTSNPASRMWSFSRVMKQAPYTIVNNRLLIDAIFTRDYHGTDSTVFAAGSNKNGMSPVLWSCPTAQGIPDKNDILDLFAHVRRAGPNVFDSAWFFGGLSLDNVTGSRYYDFELYQTDLYFDRATLSFKNYGPNFGHTPFTLDAAGNILTAGDVIFTAEFGNPGLVLVEARIWIQKTTLSITPAGFIWGGQFDGDGAGATYGYASILPKTAGAFYTGLQSANGVWAGPFSLVLQDNSITTTYLAKQFTEFSVNLTKLGIDPAQFTSNACGSPFRRVLVKTRASNSFTAELKDFVAPFKMFQYDPVDAAGVILYFCGAMPITPLYVANPVASSIYTWSTTNGNIVGTNIGTTINVNKPGTYYVTQQMDPACPVFSTDSVTILFDSICTVLDVNFIRFNASRLNRTAELKWQVDNNQMISNFIVEYSLDNRNFIPLATLPSFMQRGLSDYSFTHQLDNINADMIFYRIRAIGPSGAMKYSNYAIVRFNNDSKNVHIFPNPTQGETWLNMQSVDRAEADINISDAYGRLMSSSKVMLEKGDNQFSLPQFTNLKPGMYVVRIKSINGEINQKVILNK
ncbi:MAG TPA: T9SS type A sorting domain-containing protein [Ferruginibacter sp.]|nr:T9SS type A sorting domain-containing protein [Ferruginibacter sp.]